ncbi:MAG: S9 family peptidase [Halieaceae bacterium]|nr:S9 family peptidase [Halieaceae bacterium]
MRLFTLILGLATLVTAVSSHSSPFTAADLVRLDRVGAPVLSPAGEQVVFTLRKTDIEANKGRVDLWLASVADGTPSRLTSHEANDSQPAWSANGEHVYFLSARGGTSQLWRIAVDGGEAVAVSDVPLDIASYRLLPDSSGAVVSLNVYLDCETLTCTAERDAENAESKTSGVAYDQLFMRHWDHWLDEKRSQLFLLRFDQPGEATLLTGAVDADIPSRIWGGSEEYTISGDGKTLYFAARLRDALEPRSTNFDIYATRLDGRGKPKNLTADNEAWDTHPVLSPDGRTLAWLAMSRPGFEADQFQLVLRDLESGEQRTLSSDWDYSPSGFEFSPDGRFIYLNAQDTGHKTLWRVPAAGGKFERLAGDGTIVSFQVGERELVFARSHLKSPAELFRAALDGSDQVQLTNFSGPQLAERELGDFEQFSFAGAGGDTVHGFMVKPVNFKRGRRYPVAFLIHGGPQGSFANNFHYRWNPQTYAGAGFATVMIDFHGSTGYGQEFTDSISGDWGGKPLEDLQLGLAAALEKYAFLDGKRVCALGASYGGFMINWIAGNWPDRFRCLVNHDGVFDNRMMYYATEELWFPEWEHGGPQFLRQEAYERHNPVNYVENWQTPMLVIHGELDYRIPVTHGIAAFTALQRRGIPSRFLYFPDENHWVLQPANSELWHQEVNDWLKRWLD